MIKKSLPQILLRSLIDIGSCQFYRGGMFETSPSFRIKRTRKGQTFEMEIRASLLRWLLIGIVVLACLTSGKRPSEILQILFKSLPMAEARVISPCPRQNVPGCEFNGQCLCPFVPQTSPQSRQRVARSHGEKPTRPRGNPSPIPSELPCHKSSGRMLFRYCVEHI
jgi:hypothetical protein